MEKKLERQIRVNGFSVPRFLYGTAWKEEATQACVHAAIKAGFRGIDTANQRKHYYEEGVGNALVEIYQSGIVQRKDIFLQTKFTHRAGQDQRLPYDAKAPLHTQVLQSFASSLQHLHTEYIDSYVLHGPSMRHGLSEEDWETWRAMEELQRGGQVRFLGVSNVTLQQLQLLCQTCQVKPSFVQNRCFARMAWDKQIREYCGKNHIYYQGFSLLTANVEILQHQKFQTLIDRHGCSAAQLIFSFALEVGMLPLTGTTNPKHMQEDLEAYEIRLSSEELKLLEALLS